MVPRTVLTRSGLIPLYAARLVNTVQPRTTVNNAGPVKKLGYTAEAKSSSKVFKGKQRKCYKASTWYMTGNRSYLTDYEEIDGGFIAFEGNSKRGKITRKGKIRTGKLDFKDVYFVKELKFNLFSDSQMRDKKNSVLFTDTTCVVLSPDFKLTDESQVLLNVSRKDNMYTIDLKNVVLKEVSTLSLTKANTNELICCIGRLVTCIENLIDLRVKVIRCDNGTEFKNRVMNQFCEMNGCW
ncbi:hypothetical protein Tco_0236704 [Tanacetum coccineum]